MEGGHKEYDDEKLKELFESALSDFFTPLDPPISASDTRTASTSSPEEYDKPKSSGVLPSNFQGEKYVEKMDNILENFLNDQPELKEQWEKLNESCKKAAESESDSTEAFEALSETLKNLSESVKSMEGKEDISEEELSRLWGTISETTGLPNQPNLSASEEDGYPDLMPLVTNLMQNLLSKQVLYPSIKDLSNKYPVWLEENRDKLEPAELDRYSRQLEFMREVCVEFEAESEEDTQHIRDKRFQKILLIMQKMKDCGTPPKDLVEDGQDLGSEFDFSKMPAFDNLPKDGQGCSVM